MAASTNRRSALRLDVHDEQLRELSAAASLTSDSGSGSSSSTMIRPLDGVKEMSLKRLLLKPVGGAAAD